MVATAQPFIMNNRAAPLCFRTAGGGALAISIQSEARAGGLTLIYRARCTIRLGCSLLCGPHERVLVLLQLLGGQQRVELARSAIEAIE